MKYFLPRALTLAAVASSLYAHDIITTNLTYTRDVSRIVARRCVECHSEQSSIPLTNYEEVRPWAVDIKEQVLSRSMPPWGAVKGFGNLAPDRALTQEEILILSAWVVGGAPKGDPALLPKAQATTKATLPAMIDARIVSTRCVLEKELHVRGNPANRGEGGRQRADYGSSSRRRIEPLVWLYRSSRRRGLRFIFARRLHCRPVPWWNRPRRCGSRWKIWHPRRKPGGRFT